MGALAIALIFLSGGVSKASSPSLEAPLPNVLIITVDTLRPDALGWVSGNVNTPTFDAMANGGFRFPAAVSPVPITLPAHTSLFTGTIPRRHGVRDNSQVLASGVATLAEALSAKGYETAAFVSGFPLASQFGLDRGFDHYDDDFSTGNAWQLERPALETNQAVLAWAAQTPRPWLIWVHYYDPHEPYKPPEEFAMDGPRGDYYGEVAYTDHAVGELLTSLDQSRKGPRLTVFTSDHGESLGEHGEKSHGVFLYESTVRVPLVFHYPGRVQPGASSAAVRLVDVAPTILDLLNLPPFQDSDGRSLTPLLTGHQQVFPAAYIETQRPWLSYGWSPLKAVRKGDWKLIIAPRPELYDLSADPGETTNLIDQRRRVATELIALGRAREKAPEAFSEALDDAATMHSLRALGYVGSGTTSRRKPPPDAADPKDRIESWNLLNKAELALQGRHFREALQAFERVLKKDPTNRFALSRSGIALLELKRPADAISRLKDALNQDPDHALSHEALARVYSGQRNFDQASNQWLEVLRLQPRHLQAWLHLAEARAGAGKKLDASKALAEAARIAPRNPQLRIRLALSLTATGDLEGAVRELLRASELTAPGEFRHSGALGLLLLNLHRPEAARPWLERSNPTEGDFANAQLTLATLEAAKGAEPAARQALAKAIQADPRLRSRAASDPRLAPLLSP